MRNGLLVVHLRTDKTSNERDVDRGVATVLLSAEVSGPKHTILLDLRIGRRQWLSNPASMSRRTSSNLSPVSVTSRERAHTQHSRQRGHLHLVHSPVCVPGKGKRGV